jgi:flagellar basal body-associated protein FliL
MTRFDIRVRRKQFTQSRIEQHKNYQSLLDKHYEQSRKKTRGIMVLVFLLILIVAILLAFFNRQKEPAETTPQEPISELKIEETHELNKQEVYKL